jgi:hypothetical protein
VRRDIARIKTVATQKRPAQPGSVPAAASIKPKRVARSKAK